MAKMSNHGRKNIYLRLYLNPHHAPTIFVQLVIWRRSSSI
jgi:hypothetical protein